jgi:hypothetical protein
MLKNINFLIICVNHNEEQYCGWKSSMSLKLAIFWGSLTMGMGELDESLEGTKNYYMGVSCCIGQHCQSLL